MIILTGKGFYQLQGSELLYAPNFVDNAEFQLSAEKWDQYEYPYHGWYWFENEQMAREFFSLPMPTIKIDNTLAPGTGADEMEVVRDENGQIIGYKTFHKFMVKHPNES